MTRKIGLLLPFLLTGCTTAPQLPTWRAEALLPALPATCPGESASAAAAGADMPLVPGGVSVVRSAGRDVVIVAARSCVMTVDAGTGAAEALPTRGDSIAPTMVDGTSTGVGFSSSISGSVRAIDVTGAISFNVSGLSQPLGLRFMPGGSVYVTEYGAGRIIRVGPHDDTRAQLLADGLDGPVGLVVVDATKGYVTENLAGRVTLFRLDRFEKSTVAKGLNHPEGIALMADGRLAVAEVGLRRLIAVDPATGKIEVLADNLPIGLPAEQSAHGPGAISDVSAAPDGTLFLSADVDRTILRLTPLQQSQAQR